MDKGIRPFVNAKFVELNTLRKAGTLTNTQFRKNVMAAAMEAFGITLASAATHYNHTFQNMKKEAPAEVEGLGRPDDKNNGGRKRKEVAAAPAAPSVIPVPTPTLLETLLGTNVAPAAPQALLLEDPGFLRPRTNNLAVVETAVHSVRKVSDGTVVAEGLTLEAAQTLIAAAAKAKKAKLELVA